MGTSAAVLTSDTDMAPPRLVLLLITALVLTACADPRAVQQAPSDPAGAAAQLDGSAWRSTVVEGLDLPADQRTSLTFRDGRVEASVACGTFGGSSELVDGRVVVDELEVPSIDCPAPDGTCDGLGVRRTCEAES
jgi:heat shock protein HslJ